VRRRIKRATELLRGCPVDAVYLTGGIALGAYSPEMSDIDLVVVLSPTARAGASARAAVLDVVDDLPPVAMLLVERAQLSAAEPKALQVEGSWSREYVLHAMDVILLRDYSILLFGADFRNEMATYTVSEVIGSIIDHVVNAMLPGVIAAVRADPALSLDKSNIMGLTFLMARCLVTLQTGHLVPKPMAARWLRAEARRKPHLVPLATMASRFALWYERGIPKTVRSLSVNTQFAVAAAGFVSEYRAATRAISVGALSGRTGH
jgi:predicted nucleotidyltransferase